LGILFFEKGELFDASCGDKKGHEALFEMITWDNAGIEIVSGNPRKERVIQGSLLSVLMEAYARRDEVINKM
jgi:hypothetical protein